MANNYTQASFTIAIPDAVDRDQLNLAMEVIENMHTWQNHGDAEDPVAAFIEDMPGDLGPASPEMVKIALEQLNEVEDEYLGFDWSINDDCIWCRTGESINIESAVLCIQTLALMIPAMQASAPWYATWACTCSKMRVDEFGGGAVVFDHEHEEWMNSSSWKHKTMENFANLKAAEQQKNKT